MSSLKESPSDQVKRFLSEVALVSVDQLFEQSAVKVQLSRFKQEYEDAVEVAARCRSLSWEHVPTNLLQQFIVPAAATLHSCIIMIRELKLSNDKTLDQMAQPIVASLETQNQAEDKRRTLQYHTKVIISFIGLITISNDETSEKIRTQFNELQKFAAAKTLEIENLVSSAKSATAQAGVNRHSSNFESLAKHHELYGHAWLGAMIIVSAASIFAAFCITKNLTEAAMQAAKDGNMLVLWIGLAPKIFLLSILYSSVLWSGRNYRSHRHLQVINRQRATALDTFQSFVSASEGDPSIKNAVLLECSKSIFSHQNSGYADVNNRGSETNVVEIMRNFAKPDLKT